MGQKIRIFIEEKGIKFRVVARAIGVSDNTFSNMMNGTRKITIDEYIQICEVLNVPFETFCDKRAG